VPGTGLPGPDELRALVREILRDELRALVREALRDALPAAAAGSGNRHVQRVEKGAVTERMVAAAARDGAALVLGPRAVLTPLARDKARALGVPVQKER
jgi:predicted regulator of Ras-like GTPase activity (Roadblock/LC7/MglB family)